MKTRYWRTDLYRCFGSWQMLLAIIGVCVVHLLGAEQFSEVRVSVLRSFYRVWGSNATVLVYLFTTLAYGRCFAEDMEQGYIKYALTRGKAINYVISKCIWIAVSAEISMVFGRMLYIFLLRCRYPWEAGVGELEMLSVFGGFTGLLENGNYFMYLWIHSICQGVWAVVLALLAALVSLYTTNGLLVLAFPVMAHHLIRRISVVFGSGKYLMDPDHFFLINYNALGNDKLTVAAIFLLGVFLSVLIGAAICKSVERRVRNG